MIKLFEWVGLKEKIHNQRLELIKLRTELFQAKQYGISQEERLIESGVHTQKVEDLLIECETILSQQTATASEVRNMRVRIWQALPNQFTSRGAIHVPKQE